MRQGWVAGTVFFYLGIWWYAMMYAQQYTMSSSILTNLGYLLSPQVTDFTGSTLAQASMITHIGTYIVNFIAVCLLYFPGFWTGMLSWAYLFIGLPVSISMIIAMVTMLRGSSSS